jgi:hypothetical protein
MNTARISTFIQFGFSAPRLPLRAAAPVLLMIATQAVLTLVHQPAVYWLDARQAGQTDPLRFILATGPLVFGVLALVYLLLVGLLLTRLRQAAGLALAGLLFFVHLGGTLRLLHLGLPPVMLQDSTDFSATVSNLVSTIFGLFFIAALLPQLMPRVRPAGRLRRVLTYLAWGLGGGWLVLMLFSLAWVIPRPEDAWQPVVVAESPSPRYNAAVAYDPVRKVAVLFGGRSQRPNGQNEFLNDTWEWDGAHWQQIDTPAAPSARSGHLMVYDQGRSQVLLFSGINNNGILGDLWAWDGQAWKKQCPVCNPAGCAGFGMVYDEELQKPIIYGGYGQDEGQNVWRDDAWSWDGTAWSYEEIFSSSPGTSGFAMIYDAANRRIVAFMSGDAIGGTWIWQDQVWRKLETARQPLPAGEVSLVYDPTARRVVLFGGILNGKSALQQTWVLENDIWREIRMARAPAPRWGQAAFYDLTRQRMMLFGGDNYPREYNDLWELNLPVEAP